MYKNTLLFEFSVRKIISCFCEIILKIDRLNGFREIRYWFCIKKGGKYLHSENNIKTSTPIWYWDEWIINWGARNKMKHLFPFFVSMFFFHQEFISREKLDKTERDTHLLFPEQNCRRLAERRRNSNGWGNFIWFIGNVYYYIRKINPEMWKSYFWHFISIIWN